MDQELYDSVKGAYPNTFCLGGCRKHFPFAQTIDRELFEVDVFDDLSTFFESKFGELSASFISDAMLELLQARFNNDWCLVKLDMKKGGSYEYRFRTKKLLNAFIREARRPVKAYPHHLVLDTAKVSQIVLDGVRSFCKKRVSGTKSFKHTFIPWGEYHPRWCMIRFNEKINYRFKDEKDAQDCLSELLMLKMRND